MTLGKNFWQCLEQNEIQTVCQKNSFLYFFLKNEECLFIKFEKYQGTILGPSSSESVATLENKFGLTFPGFLWGFFKKSKPKKWNFLSKQDKFY